MKISSETIAKGIQILLM